MTNKLFKRTALPLAGLPLNAGVGVVATRGQPMNEQIPIQWTSAMSLLGAACRRVHELRVAGDRSDNWQYEEFIVRFLKVDVFQKLWDDPFAKLHLGSQLETLPTERVTDGPNGEEISYFSVRAFPSGGVVGYLGLWPGRDRDTQSSIWMMQNNYPSINLEYQQ